MYLARMVMMLLAAIESAVTEKYPAASVFADAAEPNDAPLPRKISTIAFPTGRRPTASVTVPVTVTRRVALFAEATSGSAAAVRAKAGARSSAA